MNTQEWILHSQPQQYGLVIATIYKYPDGSAECVDGFILVVKQTDKMHMVPVGAIVGPAHLVRENSVSDRIDSIWLANHHVDLHSY